MDSGLVDGERRDCGGSIHSLLGTRRLNSYYLEESCSSRGTKPDNLRSTPQEPTPNLPKHAFTPFLPHPKRPPNTSPQKPPPTYSNSSTAIPPKQVVDTPTQSPTKSPPTPPSSPSCTHKYPEHPGPRCGTETRAACGTCRRK